MYDKTLRFSCKCAADECLQGELRTARTDSIRDSRVGHEDFSTFRSTRRVCVLGTQRVEDYLSTNESRGSMLLHALLFHFGSELLGISIKRER
jgi:hypothetical protein